MRMKETMMPVWNDGNCKECGKYGELADGLCVHCYDNSDMVKGKK